MTEIARRVLSIVKQTDQLFKHLRYLVQNNLIKIPLGKYSKNMYL